MITPRALLAKLSARWIDEHQKCPRCGHRQGHIKYMRENDQEQVVHYCSVCGASWGEKPLKPGFING